MVGPRHVDLRPGSTKNVPINLALSVDGNAMLNPALPADAVQLVRLIKGERDGWIRVNFPTSSWLSVGGSPASPDANNVVSLSVGLDDYASIRPNASTPTNGNEFDDGSGLASTELCVNYANTPNFNPGDIDVLDFISYDSSTFGVEDGNNVVPGNNTGVSFSNDNQIARGELYVARFEYHVTPGEFNGPAHSLPMTRLNSVDVWHWCAPLDTVYYTNTSDFEWEPGTSLYLCLVPYNPIFLALGEPSDFNIDEPAYLADVDIEASTLEGTTWQIEKIYTKGIFVGYGLHLQGGTIPPMARIDVTGLQACMLNDLEDVDLRLAAYAYVFNDFVTEGEQIPLGPRIRNTADMFVGAENYYRQVMPYTAYDRDNWQHTTRVVNQSDQSSIVTAILFNRHGITLRVHGVQPLAPHASMDLSVADLFGAEAEGVLAWMELLSDRPFSASGIIEDPFADTFDVFSAVPDLNQTLYLPHIPSLPNIWETKTYVLSADLEQDNLFYLQLPNQSPSQIRAILVPGATAVLDEDDYMSEGSRATWLQLNATAAAGAGLAVLNKLGDSGQVATMPLNQQPDTQWDFDHVGMRENGWWNGLILCNPNLSDTTVTITGYDAEYNAIAQGVLVLDAQTRQADFVQTFLHNETAPVSRLAVNSDSPIIAFLLTGIDDNDQLTAITGNLAESKELTLPYLPSSMDSWVGLSFVNDKGQRAAISLRAYNQAGQVSRDVFLDVAAYGKRVVLLSDILELASQYTHLTVTSNVAIRGFALVGDTAHTRLATVNFVPELKRN